METTYRKRFRLKQNAETVFPTTGPENAPGRISSGSTADESMGRKRFRLKKVSKVSNGLEIGEAPIHGNLSKVSNISRQGERKPSLDDQGRLRIPLDTNEKYRWWQGGQSVFATLLELGTSDREIEAHIGPISTPESWRQWQRIKAGRSEKTTC
ncbi:MAG: hypothetical protein QTN59_09530 [Candidatus Electrothrix communis]|nr:MAG: hypothetical protein QTN59_09530 [Candidatus Electrothrix communis]